MTYYKNETKTKEGKAESHRAVSSPITVFGVVFSFIFIFIFLFSISTISALPQDTGTEINFEYKTPINYSTIPTVNENPTSRRIVWGFEK